MTFMLIYPGLRFLILNVSNLGSYHYVPLIKHMPTH